MDIYLESYCLYDFDWQRAFGARYISKNSAVSQKYWKYNENNIEYRGNIAIKI